MVGLLAPYHKAALTSGSMGSLCALSLWRTLTAVLGSTLHWLPSVPLHSCCSEGLLVLKPLSQALLLTGPRPDSDLGLLLDLGHVVQLLESEFSHLCP